MDKTRRAGTFKLANRVYVADRCSQRGGLSGSQPPVSLSKRADRAGTTGAMQASARTLPAD